MPSWPTRSGQPVREPVDGLVVMGRPRQVRPVGAVQDRGQPAAGPTLTLCVPSRRVPGSAHRGRPRRAGAGAACRRGRRSSAACHGRRRAPAARVQRGREQGQLSRVAVRPGPCGMRVALLARTGRARRRRRRQMIRPSSRSTSGRRSRGIGRQQHRHRAGPATASRRRSAAAASPAAAPHAPLGDSQYELIPIIGLMTGPPSIERCHVGAGDAAVDQERATR